MNQKFTLATMALACVTALSTTAANKIIVSNAGQTAVYSLATVSTLKFAEGNLNLFSADETAKFPLSEQLVIKFAPSAGVEDIFSNEGDVKLAYCDGMIIMEGLTSVINAQIFNTAGACIRSYENWDGSALSTDELTPGVYIVKAGQYTLKFAK